jgi:signal peptidase II
MKRIFPLVPLCLLLIAGVAADQVSKAAAARSHRVRTGLVLVPGIVDLAYTENTGAVFGLGDRDRPGSGRINSVLIALHAAGIVAIAWFLPRFRRGSRIRGAAVALILSGAAGNLIDRIRYGHVVDFIHLHAGRVLDWPFLFNVADAFICVGAAVLALDVVLRGEGKSKGQGTKGIEQRA